MTTSTQQAFIDLVVPGAILAQVATGVPASLTIAQAILETGWGATALSIQACNIFGQKAHLGDSDPYQCGTIDLPTWEVYGGKSVTITATFYRYPSVAASIRSHARYLIGETGIKAYQERPLPIGADAWARWIVTPPRCYATDPDYAPKLIRLMDLYSLRQYDATPTTPTPKEAPMAEMPITILANSNLIYGRDKPNLPLQRVVIHATCPSGLGFPASSAAGKAHDEAEWAATPQAGGAAHYTVDAGRNVEHSCPEDQRAAHDGYNANEVGIEICGQATYSRDQWLDPAVWPAVERAAQLTADICQRRGVPKVKLGVDQVRQLGHGICGHSDVTASGIGRSTHTDPGPGFPWDGFMAVVIGGAVPITPATPKPTVPLGAVTQTAFWATIRKGSTGEGVRAWTTWLHAMFHYASKVTPGPNFGADTEGATKEFQRRVHLDPDGVVGPLTITAARKLGFRG